MTKIDLILSTAQFLISLLDVKQQLLTGTKHSNTFFPRDENNKDQLSRSLFEVSDTFTPASFYLDKGRKPSESSVPGSISNPNVQSVVNKDRPSIGSINSLSSRELPPTPTAEEQQRRSNSEDEARKEINSINSQRPSQIKFQTHALLKQDINLTYQSVYENEDIGFTLKRRDFT